MPDQVQLVLLLWLAYNLTFIQTHLPSFVGRDFCFVCVYNLGMKPPDPLVDGAKGATALVIGIAGGSGSGKTTVAQAILQRVGQDRIAFLQHDSYYKDLSGLPPTQHAEVNFDHPDSLE